ncbi:MAG TPA: hypothetical protein VK359_05550 [Rubrobacteraceae bacterium]|jgi:hypothetical protein|nr:hypothetical protein [Rubrobacteraceae bacterium]
MGRLWMAALGEEALYEADLPGCCQYSASFVRASADSEGSFECPVCGAVWQAPQEHLLEPEECAFTERGSDGERRGAA